MNKLTKSSKGITIGIAIGVALNNIALGVGIGIVFSAAFVNQAKIKKKSFNLINLIL